MATSVFYDDKEAAATLVRFAFCKRSEVIAEAASGGFGPGRAKE